MRKNLRNGRDRDGHGWGRSPEVPVLLRTHVHGEDGSHSVHRGDEDADLTDPHCEQQPPGGLAVGLPLAKDLRGKGHTAADADASAGRHVCWLPCPALISSLLPPNYMVFMSSSCCFGFCFYLSSCWFGFYVVLFSC